MSKLFATCWGMLFQAFRLGYLCLRWVFLGFVSGTIVNIWLFCPFRAFSLDILGLLKPICRTLGLWQGYYARESVFSSVLLGFASRSVVFSAKLQFWTLQPFQVLCLDLDRLIGPSLVHGSGHGKGTRSYLGLVFWHGWVLSWHGQDISWHRRVHKLSSPVSRRLCQAELGSAM